MSKTYTFEEALDWIKFLEPYYGKYNSVCAERDNWKAERDMWQKQCLEADAKWHPPAAPVIIKTLTAVEVRDIYLACGVPIHVPEQFLYPADGEYQISSIEEVKRFIKWDWTNLMAYAKDALDCDDFAAHLWGVSACPGWSGLPWAYTEGMCWGGGHSIVSIVADDPPKVFFIEPQNDTLLTNEVKEIFSARLH